MERKTRKEKMDEVSSRIYKLREQILKTEPEICTERLKIITKSYKKNFNQTNIIKRAMALKDILQDMTIYILDNELIVGNIALKPKASPIFPEYDAQFVLNEIDSIDTRRADPFFITQENKNIIKEILPQWSGNSIKEMALNIFSKNERETANDLIILLTALGSGVGHMIVDYQLGLEKGLLAVINECNERLNNETLSGAKKRNYYEAVIIVCKACIKFAERYSDLALKLSKKEKDIVRKQELIKIASICKKVPAYPAENFWEAVQAFWIIQTVLQIESNGHSVSPGRFDQYMYSYYQKEYGKNNKLSEEIIQCLWLKFNEINKVRDKTSSIAFGGYPMYQNLIVGGQTPYGEDAVNELTYLCMETSEKVGMPQPSLSVRWHLKSDDKLLERACEVSSYGMGMPAYFNDEVIIPGLIEQGYTIKEARDYAIVGCVEPTVPGISEPWLTGGFINLAKFLELTIFSGYDPKVRKTREFKTCEVEACETFEEFKSAYYKQMANYIKIHVQCNNVLDQLHGELGPTPYEAIFTKGCMETGLTPMQGGAEHNSISINAVGFANVVDAFAVIKKKIYEDKEISWAEMKDSLLNNYDNHEQLRQNILNCVPKFGNDDDYVDDIAKEILNEFSKEVSKYKNIRGGSYLSALYSIACHILLAEKVGATPGGRKEEMLLADGGVSCGQGRDRNGPTALLNSVSKLDHLAAQSGMLLNVKINPTLVKEYKGINKIAAMTKAFFLSKGTHIQYNVVDAQTLIDAQQNPENYPTLIVRVAGFSVFFSVLDKMTQDDIIKRTEHC